jgi:hypothetical protein
LVDAVTVNVGENAPGLRIHAICGREPVL